MKTDTYKNAETLRQIFSADEYDRLDNYINHKSSEEIDKFNEGDKIKDIHRMIGKPENLNDNSDNDVSENNNVSSVGSSKSLECTVTFSTALYEEKDVFQGNTLSDINDILVTHWKLTPVKTAPGTTHQQITRKFNDFIYTFEVDIEIKEIPETVANGNIVEKTVIKDDYYYGNKSFGELLDLLINSNRRNNMKKTIKSGRFIKSGTSNFGSNDDIFGYSFPLVAYIAENYHYDEETDSETEERDYDADSWEYEDAAKAAEDLADEMNIPMYKDYSEPYLCGEPFMIEIENGYYEGLYIKIREGTNEEDIYDTNEYGSYYNGGREFTDEEMNEFADKMDAYLDKLCSDYGWQKLGVSARFSNGETMYTKINNSRKPIKSAKTVADAEEELLIDLHDIRPVFEENGYTLEDAKNFERMTWEEALPTIKSIPELAEMFEITSSRKPVISGLTFRQAVQDFKAAGQWNDYYEMQQDWEAYKDGLERDGVISEKTRSTWGNPCTREGFKKWNK